MKHHPPVDTAGAVDAERTRPPLLGKPQNGFPQRPQGLRLNSHNGDTSIELKPGTFLFRFDKVYRVPLM